MCIYIHTSLYIVITFNVLIFNVRFTDLNKPGNTVILLVF